MGRSGIPHRISDGGTLFSAFSESRSGWASYRHSLIMGWKIVVLDDDEQIGFQELNPGL